MTSEVETQFYTVSQVCKILNVSRDMVYSMIYSGDLPHISLKRNVKNKYLIPIDRFEEWLKMKEVEHV